LFQVDRLTVHFGLFTTRPAAYARVGIGCRSYYALGPLFGTDVAFVDQAQDADGFAPRSLDRIFAAAEEAGISGLSPRRFRSGNLDGRALGQCVAAAVNSLSWRR
jgi:hypothetical protein